MNRYISKNRTLINKLYNSYNKKKCFSVNLGEQLISSKEEYLINNSFNYLPIDKNNDELIKTFKNLNYVPPTRFRRYANLDVNISNNIAEINLNIDKLSFSQKVNDFRKEPRTFELIDVNVLSTCFFSNLIANTAFLVNKISDKKNLNISVHQVRQICYPEFNSDNSPEGIHRDGANFIISAFVINKSNVKGGKSIVYEEDKSNIVLSTILDKNEALFQEDEKYWHYVNPISCKNENYIGIRDIFGLDINYLKE